MNNLLDSKTNRMVLIGISLSVLLALVGIAIEIIFDHSVFEYIALAMGKLGLDTGLATYRNVKTDVPIRQQAASLELAATAKNMGLEVDSEATAQQPGGLAIWKPTGGGK